MKAALVLVTHPLTTSAGATYSELAITVPKVSVPVIILVSIITVNIMVAGCLSLIFEFCSYVGACQVPSFVPRTCVETEERVTFKMAQINDVSALMALWESIARTHVSGI